MSTSHTYLLTWSVNMPSGADRKKWSVSNPLRLRVLLPLTHQGHHACYTHSDDTNDAPRDAHAPRTTHRAHAPLAHARTPPCGGAAACRCVHRSRVASRGTVRVTRPCAWVAQSPACPAMFVLPCHPCGVARVVSCAHVRGAAWAMWGWGGGLSPLRTVAHSQRIGRHAAVCSSLFAVCSSIRASFR